ncbi:MAG TPA: transporter substrate-binding domain-containing protein [Trueperaceae bacterium]
MTSESAGTALRLGLVIGLVVLASFLPPDTSLQQVREAGVLRVCVPTSYPPLVTGDARNPGLDVDLVKAVAKELGVDAYMAVNPAMGTSFDPRKWNVTRSQCQLLAGGTVDTATTRSFLEVTPSYLVTGWMLITPEGRGLGELTRVGVYFSNVNFDRLELSQFLGEEGIAAVPLGSVREATAALEAGEVDGLLMEALTATRVADLYSWNLEWASERLTSYPLVLGMWKGDVTLKRAVVGAMRDLEVSGRLDDLRERYGVAEIGVTKVEQSRWGEDGIR